MPHPTTRPSAKVRRTRAARRPIEAEDLLCIVSVSDAQVAPDGARMAFVRTVANTEQRVESSIWTADAGGKGPRALTRGVKDSMPRFSPDGRQIAFLRAAEGTPAQVAIISLEGGEARTLTRFPEGSIRSIAWSPDGTRLVVSYRPKETGGARAVGAGAKARAEGEQPRVIESLWHKLDGDGWFGTARHCLHLVDARTGNATLLYDEDSMGEAECAWSPDGSRLAVTTNRDPQPLQHLWKSEILLLDVSARAASATPLRVPDLPIGPKVAVAWSPDGSHLAWAGRAGREGAYSPENLELWVAPVARGRRSKRVARGARSLTHRSDFCLLAPTLSDSAEVAFKPTIAWRDPTMLLTRIGWHGGGHLAAVPLDGSGPRFLTEGLVDHVIGNAARDGRCVAAVRATPTAPSEAGLLELDARATRARWRPLTTFNRDLCDKLDLAAPTDHWVTADDGHRTHVWVLRPPAGAPKPPRARKARGRLRRPAILQVHGGPHTQYGACFFHEMQVLAAQGYIVAYSNPRGSKGYGRDHCAAIRGAWGDRDWADVQAVTAHLQSLPDVDAKRIGIAGGSYGGYMTNWAIGHSKAYRAAITDRCVSNMLSMAGTSDYPLIPGEYWPGSNYENPEPMWRMSPIAHFKGVTTPTLIIHSEGDLRCPIEQAEQVFTALMLQGVPTRFVRYPRDTSHGMSRSGPPDMRLHRLRENLAWWKRWL